jgi:hypothetical protein
MSGSEVLHCTGAGGLQRRLFAFPSVCECGLQLTVGVKCNLAE